MEPHEKYNSEKLENKSLMTENTNLSSQPLDEEERNRQRAYSLSIKPGEEELYSKKINIDDFEIEMVLGKGAYGRVLLGK